MGEDEIDTRRDMRTMAAMALCIVAACSKPAPVALLASSDPAIDFYLRAQPAAYGGIARWAHQYMLVDEAVSRLTAQGFECPPPARDTKTRTCDKREGGFMNKLTGKIRSERVVITLKHPGPRIGKIEGMRYEDTSRGPVYSEAIAAPGLSFRDMRLMADYVLDAHREWHKHKYCFPAAAARGCEELRQERADAGWPRWDGVTPVAIGTARESAENLRDAGFACDSVEALKKAGGLGNLLRADGRAWIECVSVALDGQELRVRIMLSPYDLKMEMLNITAGNASLDIPVEREA
jgi:hypothetical protein